MIQSNGLREQGEGHPPDLRECHTCLHRKLSMNVYAMFVGAAGGVFFGFFVSWWNRKRSCPGTVCQINGDPRTAMISYGAVGALLGLTFHV